ncbi:MAG TPA: dihydrofolate reductase family protein [Steroidobacteraceae bacterium]|jgi:riboflavin biosynthesis pyrimidine reductase|nr:dihydrofolate reductase family protein [Steroidobacteraceae bacterium]
MTRSGQAIGRIAPLRTLLEAARGGVLPLSPTLARLYGTLRLPLPRSGCLVISNFVSTLDGVVSLQVKGHGGGGDISGFSAQDRMVMGLLRAAVDAVVVGSGTLAADPRHVWTPEAICPELGADYRRLQASMGKRAPALNVIVSAEGTVDLRLPVFAAGRVPAMIITTARGAKRLLRGKVPDSVQLQAVRRRGGQIAPAVILDEIARSSSGRRILVEGGPRLLGTFYAQRLVDQQFLSLAPQLSGRQFGDARMSLVMGRLFAPSDPLWGRLVDARIGRRLLFLRYAF